MNSGDELALRGFIMVAAIFGAVVLIIGFLGGGDD